MGTKTDDRLPDSGVAGCGLNTRGDQPRPDDLRPRPSASEPPVTRAERLAVLRDLGAPDAAANLRELNGKALAIIDAIAMGLREDHSKLKRRGFVLTCPCGASFGTRAENLTQAATQASDHGWLTLVDGRFSCSDCAREAAGGGSSVPGLVEGGPAPRGERSSVHPVDQVLEATIEGYASWPLPPRRS